MALSQRRSSMDTFNRRNQSEQSETEPEWRKLSFNPVGEWIPPSIKQQTLGAYEVSKKLRIAQVCIAVVYCLLAAGIVFGFAALKPILVSEGVYRDQCTPGEIEENVYVCYAQELRLNIMFTVAAVSTNVAALPIGTILDRFGPRVASIVGVVFIVLGVVSLAFAGDLQFDAYIPGYFFISLGSPFVFISSFQLSNAFPKHSGLILALLTGAFDSSSAIFLAYRLVYQGTDGALSPKKFFLGYLIVPLYILIAQIFVMPANSYKTVGELVKQADDPAQDAHDSDDDISDDEQREAVQAARREHRESVVSEITALLGSKDGDQQAGEEEQKAKRSGVYGAMHGKTALQQIVSPWFVLITLFTIIQMMRINYFIATIWNQYSELFDSADKATKLNQFFDVALPVGGVIAIPFVGLLLDHTSTPFTLSVMVTTTTAIGVLGCIPESWAGYANVCVFVLYRPFFYTAVSDYAAKVFGFATFGKVYGLIICLSGLFNFAQAGLDALTHKAFDNDPVPVNMLLTGTNLAIGTALAGYVGRKSYTMARVLLEQEAEGAREVLMPNVLDQRTYGTNT